MLLNFIFHLREDRDRLLELSGTFRGVWKAAVAILMNRNISLSQQSPWNKQVCRYALREDIKTYQNISKNHEPTGIGCTRFFQVSLRNKHHIWRLELVFCSAFGGGESSGITQDLATVRYSGRRTPTAICRKKKDDGITGNNIVTPKWKGGQLTTELFP